LTRHLLVIGAQRCGTTYLQSLLEAHPEITMARPARPEPKVFLSDASVDRGRDWYRRTFFGHATHERLLGEKSTSYIEVPEAADRAYRVLGDDTVVLALLRDPVARAVSNWRFSTDNGLEERPLETALRENLAEAAEWDRASTSVSPFAYLERGRYEQHLEPWFAAFPMNLQVVFLQDLLDRDEALGTLYQHLGVDPDFRPATREQLNESTEPTSSLPPDLVSAMRTYFHDHDLALSRRLGRRLPWPPEQPPTRSDLD
jgi:hypothetical protein